jgi:hypothetical protein
VEELATSYSRLTPVAAIRQSERAPRNDTFVQVPVLSPLATPKLTISVWL